MGWDRIRSDPGPKKQEGSVGEVGADRDEEKQKVEIKNPVEITTEIKTWVCRH